LRVLSVIGKSGSGKTTIIEGLIKELKNRGYTIGSVKEIHFEDFTIDEKGTNTDRHYRAGSELVTARGLDETDLLFKRRLELDEILKYYNHDYVILEGVKIDYIPTVITAVNKQDIDELMGGNVFAVSGKIAEDIDHFRDLPVINGLKNSKKLSDIVEDNVFEKLPGFKKDCCGACGLSCSELAEAIIDGSAEREQCLIDRGKVRLYIGGREIKMVGFVKKILKNTVSAVVKELKGYRPGDDIEIKISDKDGD